jgi:hypothetical protein
MRGLFQATKMFHQYQLISAQSLRSGSAMFNRLPLPSKQTSQYPKHSFHQYTQQVLLSTSFLHNLSTFSLLFISLSKESDNLNSGKIQKDLEEKLQ